MAAAAKAKSKAKAQSKSKAKPASGPMSVEEFIASLPGERRDDIAATRALVRKHLPEGYTERMAGAFISFEIPLADHPDTYNGQPLPYVCIGAQKNYNALYLMGCYTTPAQRKRLEDAYEAAGRKLDMGKSCLRFRAFGELPAKVLGELIAEVSPAQLIRIHEAARRRDR